ncbi:DUF4351 domain-containing protein [Fischerella thermalis]|uniref:DUF4351 domain-containing protein n=1 Tax=Fischerella thermalis CCMEE 5318 TaxID=2019666 RepID=A0A2N6LBC3_9CYAN|nr:DUF4351 domain-containing protein [Fischerella thermalis]PMB19957.1 hypothetical protein CEN46_17440 [Fischerella thermalis CCMEE 5318]
MAFDNLCKLLSETYPDRFATWLLGETPTSIEVLKTELSIEPIRADSVTFLSTPGRILHLEFQVKIETTPPLSLRMLDYWVRLYRRYRLPITQVVILLKPVAEATEIESEFNFEQTRHRYRVVRMWEQDPEIFLQDPALLPLATLAATTNPEQLLSRVAKQVSMIETIEQRREVAARTQLLAGLKFEKGLIRKLFRGEAMRESVIYQEILEEGRQEGRQEGELALLLKLLTRRVGTLPPELQMQIQALPLTQIEELGEALLDFSELADLVAWLQTSQQ